MVLEIKAGDTKDLIGQRIEIDGDEMLVKVGENDNNHFRVPNEKKMYNSQFSIIRKDGRFYIRDLGELHNCRLKVQKNWQYQVHKNDVIDFGKVVHYYFNKVVHEELPSAKPSARFFQKSKADPEAIEVEADDKAMARLRPYQVTVDDPKQRQNILNEIIFETTAERKHFSVGKHKNRQAHLNLAAVSNFHCTVEYEKKLGWHVHENGKPSKYDMSTNGTFLFLKNVPEMDQQRPSELVRLQEGMVITVINYEIHVVEVKENPCNDSDFFQIGSTAAP